MAAEKSGKIRFYDVEKRTTGALGGEEQQQQQQVNVILHPLRILESEGDSLVAADWCSVNRDKVAAVSNKEFLLWDLNDFVG